MGRGNGSTPELRGVRTLLRSFFADYLRIIEPDVAAGMQLDRILWRRQTIEGAGLAAEVAGRREGERVNVLVQIEPEALSADEAFLRISRSLRSLRLRCGEPVLASVVHLRGGRPGRRLESGVLSQACGIELARLYFTTFGLAETRAEPYLDRPEPLAWALAARMRPISRTAEAHRRACLERIANADIDEKRRALLLRGVRAARRPLLADTEGPCPSMPKRKAVRRRAEPIATAPLSR